MEQFSNLEKLKIKQLVYNSQIILFLTENGHIYNISGGRIERSAKRENIE